MDDLVDAERTAYGDAGVVMAQRRADLARGEVEDPLAGGGLDPRSFGARDRLGGE